MKLRTSLLAAAAVAFAGAAHAAIIPDFNSASDAAAWTTDRYAPATFASGVAYGGHSGTLSEATSVADGADNRPAAYSSSFYDTQGKALDLGGDATDLSIQLYLDPDYANATDGTRIAGLWGVAYDGTDSLSAYPIIEFGDYDSTLQFRGWDSNGDGAWNTLGTPTDFSLGSWATLDIRLDTVSDQFFYSVNGQQLGAAAAGGSQSIQSVILQTYNTTEGTVDAAHWDNLSAGTAPEPSTWALMIMGLAGVGSMLRRRRNLVAA